MKTLAFWMEQPKMWNFYTIFLRYFRLRTLMLIITSCFHIILIIHEYQLILISFEDFLLCLKLVVQCVHSWWVKAKIQMFGGKNNGAFSDIWWSNRSLFCSQKWKTMIAPYSIKWIDNRNMSYWNCANAKHSHKWDRRCGD